MIPLIAKRTMVREHLEMMAREAHAAVAKDLTYAEFLVHRASAVEQMSEVELDLLLADWHARHEYLAVIGRNNEHLAALERAKALFAIRPSSRLPKPGEVWMHVGVDANGQPSLEEMRVCDPAQHDDPTHRLPGYYRVALLEHPNAVCQFPLSSLEFVRES